MKKGHNHNPQRLIDWRNESGITGLETAIVLIAFVVVASVFAFAVLSTGLLSSEKAKETVLGGLEETGASLALRGSVIAHQSTTLSTINWITFQVSNASQTGEAVSLNAADTVVTYLDSSQSVSDIPVTTSTDAPWTGITDWTATWLSGTSGFLNPGERVEIAVGLQGLATPLGISTEFTIEVRPSRGAVLIVNRTTPGELTTVVDLN